MFICHTYRVHRPSTSSEKKEKGFHQLQLGQSANCINNRCCTTDHQVKNSSLEKYRALLKDNYPSAKNMDDELGGISLVGSVDLPDLGRRRGGCPRRGRGVVASRGGVAVPGRGRL